MISNNYSSEVHEFVQMQVKAFSSFNIDNSEKSLDKGVWYCTDYFDALQTKQKPKRVEWMKEKNICWQGYVNSKYFDPVNNLPFTFVAKTSVLPSDALEQLEKGLALLECGTAVQLSCWIALKDYIGLNSFNALLSLGENVFSPLYLQGGAYILSHLYQQVEIKDEQELLSGDLCYFKNIKEYVKRHPFGSGTGYNTVCVFVDGSGSKGGTKFMGFGLSVEGNSSVEIESQLFHDYNKEPLKPSVYFSKEKAERIPSPYPMKTLTREAFQKLSGNKGRLVLKVRRLWIDRLEQLKKTPPKEMGSLVKSWR